MTVSQASEAFATAHRLLAETRKDYRQRSEDPDDPSTVQAMQLVILLPKVDPPSRNQVLVDAAKATVAVCLDPRAGVPGFWRDGLGRWYDHRIRKVARRARGKAWEDVQALPGVTVGSVRAFVPTSVADVPHVVSKLQIKGTDLEQSELLLFDANVPTIYVNSTLNMSLGKAAAQVGHAAMLYAAQLPEDAAYVWSQQDFALNVREVDAAEFARVLSTPGAVPVQDAGFKEVAPGSTTVVAVPPAG